VTLQNLMISNHGMYDLANEVLLPNGSESHADEAFFFKLDQFLGLRPIPPPNATDGFGQLNAYGPESATTRR
jgi:hypothetical protein